MKTTFLKIAGAFLSIIIPIILLRGQYNLEFNGIDLNTISVETQSPIEFCAAVSSVSRDSSMTLNLEIIHSPSFLCVHVYLCVHTPVHVESRELC